MTEQITATISAADTGIAGMNGKPRTGLEVTSADYYFDSYAHFGIHEEMLKDEVRTKSYMNAIEKNKHLFAGKVVLDVGCGTGILSMFAARAGAAKVFAVECSSIVEQARDIVRDNGYADVIDVIRGKMEDITLPVQYVDIIISEWMGYFLLYESMLDTVLYARDKYLRPETGIILPDKAVLYICAIEDGDYKKEKIQFWDNVYGFNMRVIRDIALSEPLVDAVDAHSIMSEPCAVLKLDLMTCTKQDLSFSSPFSLKCIRNDYCDAFVAYFDCAFTQLHKTIYFSTSPRCKYTHWKQTVFYLDTPLTACEGEVIEGHITVTPNSNNHRDLNIDIQHKFEGHNMTTSGGRVYRLR